MAYDELPNLGSGDVLTVGWVDQAEANAAAFLGIAQPVTSLPASPSQGDTVRYAPVSAGSPPIWLCTWDTNLNGGTGAWSVVGPPLYAEVLTLESTTSTSYVDLSTVGPSATIPAAGIYKVESHVRAAHGAASTWMCSYVGPGVSADDDNRISGFGTADVGYSGIDRVTFTAAGTVRLVYRTLSGTASFRARRIAITPLELRP
ncbi:hypothetical protein [Microcystis phage Mae-JY09]